MHKAKGLEHLKAQFREPTTCCTQVIMQAEPARNNSAIWNDSMATTLPPLPCHWELLHTRHKATHVPSKAPPAHAATQAATL
jgi:hypothetical protein